MTFTLMPFLYQTRTILRIRPYRASAVAIRAMHATRRPPERDTIPFDYDTGVPEENVPIQESRGTITPTERQIFERIFADIEARGLQPTFMKSAEKKAASRSSRSAMLIMQQAAHDAGQGRPATVTSPAILSGAANDRAKALLRFPPPLRGAAGKALDTIIRQATKDAPHATQSSSVPKQDEFVDDDWKAPAHTFARTVEIEAKRYPERTRVEGLITSAKSDIELWDILEKEVFTLPARLGIMNAKDKKANLKTRRRRRTAKAQDENTADAISGIEASDPENASEASEAANPSIEASNSENASSASEDASSGVEASDPENLSSASEDANSSIEASNSENASSVSEDASSSAEASDPENLSSASEDANSSIEASNSENASDASSGVEASNVSEDANSSIEASDSEESSSVSDDANSGIEASDSEESSSVSDNVSQSDEPEKLSLYIHGPLYPAYLLLALRRLNTAFHRSSPLVFSILPRIKELGLESYVLGVSTPFFNDLLDISWTRYGDLSGMLDLLEEMRHCGLYFDKRTASILGQAETALSELSSPKGRSGFGRGLMLMPEYEYSQRSRIQHWHKAVDASAQEKYEDIEFVETVEQQ